MLSYDILFTDMNPSTRHAKTFGTGRVVNYTAHIVHEFQLILDQ